MFFGILTMPQSGWSGNFPIFCSLKFIWTLCFVWSSFCPCANWASPSDLSISDRHTQKNETWWKRGKDAIMNSIAASCERDKILQIHHHSFMYNLLYREEEKFHFGDGENGIFIGKTFGNVAWDASRCRTSISISYSWGIACSYLEWLMWKWIAFQRRDGSAGGHDWQTR